MFKVEVIADDSGKWCSNQVTFATEAEAAIYGGKLARNWTLVREWRVVEIEEADDAA